MNRHQFRSFPSKNYTDSKNDLSDTSSSPEKPFRWKLATSTAPPLCFGPSLDTSRGRVSIFSVLGRKSVRRLISTCPLVILHGPFFVCCVCCHSFRCGRLSTTFGICGHISRGHAGGRTTQRFSFSYVVSVPPAFFCGACLVCNREKSLAVPSPRRP